MIKELVNRLIRDGSPVPQRQSAVENTAQNIQPTVMFDRGLTQHFEGLYFRFDPNEKKWQIYTDGGEETPAPEELLQSYRVRENLHQA